MCLADGFGDKAREAADRAINAQSKAMDAETRVTVIVNRLPEDQRKMKEIPQYIYEANRNVREAESQVNDVLRLVPIARDYLFRLSEQAIRIKQLGLDIGANITELRNQITVARTAANLVSNFSSQ